MHIEPDSSGRTEIIMSQILSNTKSEINEDRIEITSIDCNSNTSLQPGNNNPLLTDPDSSTTVKNINPPKKNPSYEIDEIEIIEERDLKKVLNEEDEVAIVEERNDEDEIEIIEERKLEKEKLPHIPTKILIRLIAKAIESSSKGYVTMDNIQECVLQRFPYSGMRARFVKKLILNTLNNQSDTFMSIIIKEETGLQSGFWTLHPRAAANFINCDKEKRNLREQNCGFKQQVTPVHERPQKQPILAIKRLSSLDEWASRSKIAKMETCTVIVPPSEEVRTSLKSYGVTFEMKWQGWSSNDKKQRSKILKLEKIISCANKSLNPDPSKSGKRKKQEMNQTSSQIGSSSTKSSLKTKGVKRIRLSDSCSELEVSNYESANGSVVLKDHNYVASQDSSGSKNLIENLQKIVQKMDRDCDKKPASKKNRDIKSSIRIKQDEKEGQDDTKYFLGFDNDKSNGHWRGWEKASSRNEERMKEILSNLEGRRDLEEVLKESDIAVTRCIEELEKYYKSDSDKMQDTKHLNVEATVKKHVKELLTFDNMTKEQPISYLVLIVMAICDSSEPAVTVEDVCRFIQQNFPFHCKVGKHYLETVVEVVLRFYSPSIFNCQKCRRLNNTFSCWRVVPAAACRILERALRIAKARKQPTKNILKKSTEEDKRKALGVSEKDKRKPKVIHNANILESPMQVSHTKQNIPSDIYEIQVNGENCNAGKEIPLKQDEVNKRLGNKEQIPTSKVENVEVEGEHKIVWDIKKSAVVSSIVVDSKVDIYCKSTDNKSIISSVSQLSCNNRLSTLHSTEIGMIENSVNSRKYGFVKKDFSPPASVVNNGPVILENNEVKSSGKFFPQVVKEENELEIVDIDPTLLVKVKSNKSSEFDEILVIDEGINCSSNRGCERLFGKERTSFTNKVNIQSAQTHLGKSNVHITTSPLYEDFQWKPNDVIIPCERGFGPEGLPSRTNMEKLNLDLHCKKSDSVLRYSCCGCKAVFLEREMLNLHMAVVHHDKSMRSATPIKQFSTPEGNQLYYCNQCFGCFHTKKALRVHACVPFSRTQSSPG